MLKDHRIDTAPRIDNGSRLLSLKRGGRWPLRLRLMLLLLGLKVPLQNC